MGWLVCTLTIAVVAAEPATRIVYVVRHGEKVSGNGCLNATGEQRAQALPTIFNGQPSALHETFSTPAALFAFRYATISECERCLQFLRPIELHLSLPVDFRFGHLLEPGGDAAAAADAIRNVLRSGAPTALVAWEHHNIRPLVEQLGVPAAEVPEWPDDDFDSVFVLTLDADAKAVASFAVAAENFSPTALGQAATGAPKRPLERHAAISAGGAASTAGEATDSSAHHTLRRQRHRSQQQALQAGESWAH